MERMLGRIFLVLILVFLTFIFYLRINSIGAHIPLRVLMNWEKRQNEIDCYYFTGVTIQKVTFHNARIQCPDWIEIY